MHIYCRFKKYLNGLTEISLGLVHLLHGQVFSCVDFQCSSANSGLANYLMDSVLMHYEVLFSNGRIFIGGHGNRQSLKEKKLHKCMSLTWNGRMKSIAKRLEAQRMSCWRK
jgi:hypothetical protein